MSLAHRGTVPHHRLDFLYSNKDHLVQFDDTTIKNWTGLLNAACWTTEDLQRSAAGVRLHLSREESERPWNAKQNAKAPVQYFGFEKPDSMLSY